MINHTVDKSNRNRLLSSVKAFGSMGSNSDSEEDEEDRPLSPTKWVKKPVESKKRRREKFVVDDDSDDDNQNTAVRDNDTVFVDDE